MSKPEFLADLRSVRTELRESLARGDVRTLASARVPGTDWTAKDVLAHLIGYDLAILNAISDVREGRPFTWPWTYPNFDPWNESNVGPRRARPFGAVQAELETSRADLVRELEGWPDDHGPVGLDSWDLTKSEISWLGPHEPEHALMIAKLGAGAAG